MIYETELSEDDAQFSDEEIVECTSRPNVSGEIVSADMSCGLIQISSAPCLSPNQWMIGSESTDSFSELNSPYDEYIYDDCFEEESCDESTEPNESLLTLEDLRLFFNQCSTCGVSWTDNHISLDCKECGGYSLSRPCPHCDGECGSKWKRNITLSHSKRKAHWEGQCKLIEESPSELSSSIADDLLLHDLKNLSVSS